MEEQTFTYIVVEDGVIVNRTVGTIDTVFDNWIKETYPTAFGWKLNETVGAFIPNNMTTEEFNDIKSQIISESQEQKTYYDTLVASEHFLDKISEEKQKEVNNWLSYINKKIIRIEDDNGYVIPYHLNMVSEYASEPFSIRPNIENEV